ncbi:MAG: tetratricopeptide repeat protein [Candidatus Sericytochromatia bacterium]
MRPDQQLNQAWQNLSAGRWEDAEKSLLQMSLNSEALAMLGSLYYQQEDYEKAIPKLEKALKLAPKRHDLYPLLGAALQLSGRVAEALPWYQKILKADPENPSHLYNLASALKEAAQYAEAAQLFEKLLSQHPEHLRARNNFGVALLALGRIAAASEQFEWAVKLAPDYALAWINLGDARLQLGQLITAKTAFEKALTQMPKEPSLLARMGRVCQLLGELEAAAKWLEKALKLTPHDSSLWRSQGVTLQALGHWPAAQTAFEKALSLNPDYAEARNNLGNLLKEQGQMAQAQTQFEQVLSQSPSDAQRIRLATLAPPVYASLEDLHHWRQRIEKAVGNLAELPLQIADQLTEIGQANFYLAYQGYNDRELQMAIAGLYRPLLPEQVSAQTDRPQSERKRVGFLSGFFYNHSICHYYTQHILGLDPAQFEVFLLLAPGNPQDSATDRLSAFASQTLRLPRDLSLARQQVADLHLDALIYPDIGMEPFGYFLAMTRLAPIQAVLPGHPVTTGIPTLDYFVSNAPMELPEAQEHYSETLITLPGLPVSYAKPEMPKTWLSRTELGLPEQKHLYLCAMTLFKIHPLMDVAFKQILETDPLAEICLFRFQETGQHLLLQERLQRSLGPLAERVKFLPWASKEAFFSLLAQADLALDSHPFGGGSTHFLTLATGTPVLTWASPWLRGRSAAGMYQLLEIPELVTVSAQDFARRAVEIATQRELRHALSQRILAGHSLLFDNLQGPREFATWLTSLLKI